MRATRLVTDDDVARAREDPAFRHHLVAENLDLLLGRLNKMHKTEDHPEQAPQIREAVKLAVQLAELLQRISNEYQFPRSTSDSAHGVLPFQENAL